MSFTFTPLLTAEMTIDAIWLSGWGTNYKQGLWMIDVYPPSLSADSDPAQNHNLKYPPWEEPFFRSR